MSSKFRIWVDDDHLNKVQTFSQFDEDTQRTAGFTGGTASSATRVNTALRQANLIACALMELVDPTGTVDFRSSVSDVQTLINTYLSTNLNVNNSNYAGKIGTSSSHPAIGSADRPTYVANTGVVTAGSYIPKLNGTSQNSDASFYAPTGAGTNGQVLKSNGSGAPTWVNQSTLSVGSAASATNATNDSDGNAINTTYAKKTDFNTSSQTKFGDYIVSKKILIWSGSAGAGTIPATGDTVTNTINITLDKEIPSGAKLEYVTSWGIGFSSNTEISIRDLYHLSNNTWEEYLSTISLSGSGKSYSVTLKAMVKKVTYGNTVTSTGHTHTISGIALYKIYAIIE